MLEDLFESIQMDGRHGEVTVLHFEPIAERSFAEWAMALAGIEAHQRFGLDGCSSPRTRCAWPRPATT